MRWSLVRIQQAHQLDRLLVKANSVEFSTVVVGAKTLLIRK
jgi:hypothetical protein